ncbi:MAG TPA: hypothetical protein DCW29_03410 [Janthinobacterium sp.]|nr:hypothetical protein [Janthinobacterium sp.]
MSDENAATATHLPLRCDCGTAQGVLTLEPKSGMHLVCYCDDCRAFIHALGRPDILDAAGGSELFVTTPSRLSLSAGLEHLRCLRLSKKGMLRWYWACCDTPLANTRDSAGPPFVSIHRACIAIADAAMLGPPTRVQARFATGPTPAGAKRGNSLATILKIVRFLLLGRLRGENMPTPFFGAGAAVVVPRVLSHAERNALRPPA